MGSCEYMKVSGPRKTKLLTLNNIRFSQGRRLLSFGDPLVHLTGCVSITFELQKKDTKNDIITQHRPDDPIIFPVKIWANIVCCISNYPNSTKDTTMKSFLLPNNKIHLFTGTKLLNTSALLLPQ
jgi:hypothetical protein